MSSWTEMRKHASQALKLSKGLFKSSQMLPRTLHVTVANITQPLGGEDEVVNLSGQLKPSRTILNFIPTYFTEGDLCVTFVNV